MVGIPMDSGGESKNMAAKPCEQETFSFGRWGRSSILVAVLELATISLFLPSWMVKSISTEAENE